MAGSTAPKYKRLSVSHMMAPHFRCFYDEHPRLFLYCVQVEDALETLVSQPGKSGGEAEASAAGIVRLGDKPTCQRERLLLARLVLRLRVHVCLTKRAGYGTNFVSVRCT